MGRVQGAQVMREEAVDAALGADGPFVIDVVVDPDAVAPTGARTKR